MPKARRNGRTREEAGSDETKVNTRCMRLASLKLDSVHDLLIAELRDLHDAEQQLVEALPKMAEAASSTELKDAFTHHLGETKKHVTRLDGIFKNLNEKPGGETVVRR